MEFLHLLWLPILLSAVALQIASTIAWTIAPHHNSDWKRLPEEDEVMAALRKTGATAGNYMFPYCLHGSDMKSKEMQEKFAAGPRGSVALWDLPNMGANMFWTFVFFLVTVIAIGYAAFAAMGTGAGFTRVFQVVGTIAILTYSAAGIPNGIWFKRPILTNLIDGICYGLIVAAIFAWRWPG